MSAPLLLAAMLALAAPATVDLGGSTRLYAQADDGAQLIALQLVVSAGTAHQAIGKSGLAALTAETMLRTKIEGVPLLERVTRNGGSLAVQEDERGPTTLVVRLPATTTG